MGHLDVSSSADSRTLGPAKPRLPHAYSGDETSLPASQAAVEIKDRLYEETSPTCAGQRCELQGQP